LNLPFLGLILPIGISFFTFSAISYVFDIYRGTIQPEKKFYKYALFISYFPHLLAGPIVRASQFLPQLKNRVSLSPDNLKTGVTIMLWGFVKKFVIADNCAPIVNAIFANPTSLGTSSPYIVYGTLLFGIQIYCDFSGYIDIALGAAELIGLHLPQNFFRPYLSKSPTEFWRRWNITLSSFIRDYVYIPLGGNRKGKIRTYFNLEISMLLCGLWHGAGLKFVIWGGYHGVLLSLHKFVAKRTGSFPKILPSLNDHFKIFVKIIITQYFIFLGWIMFRATNLPDMIYCVNKYVLFDFDFSKQDLMPLWGITTIFGVINGMGLYIKIFSIIAVVIAVVLLLHNDYWMKKIINILTIDWTQSIASLQLKYWMIYLTIMILLLLCFTPSTSPVFIYYQF
jgi:alginate O-acetyltransferase complex protein AlgI